MHDITDFLFGKKTLKKAASQGAPAPAPAPADQSYDYLKAQIAASTPHKPLPPALQPTRKQLRAPAIDPAAAELASPKKRGKK